MSAVPAATHSEVTDVDRMDDVSIGLAVGGIAVGLAITIALVGAVVDWVLRRR
jgi:hypothetical protein